MGCHKASPARRDDAGMTGPRSRDLTGSLRQKRGDTRVGTIEEHYGFDFHCRSDMKLKTLRKEVRLTGIKELVEAPRCGKQGFGPQADPQVRSVVQRWRW